MAIIRQLKNFFTKQVIYPKTLTKAVYDEGGERLDKILRDTMLATDSVEYSGVEPRDADTLGGKYKASDIEKIDTDLKESIPVKLKISHNGTRVSDVKSIGYYYPSTKTIIANVTFTAIINSATIPCIYFGNIPISEDTTYAISIIDKTSGANSYGYFGYNNPNQGAILARLEDAHTYHATAVVSLNIS